ncbi:MAG: hypothetical protein V2I54_12680 [Bacteroidales bacterium]|jgi:predicted Fe-Mo cluster-binding NifX family protein|nr:hypothetical protein [Bacteroidales bacterium]
MNLRFAFALNTRDQFEEKYFGNLDKFVVFELVSGKLKKVFEIENEFKEDAAGPFGVNEQKAENIARKLLSHDIKVIVSKHFGENIKLVNAYFIPVKMLSDIPEEAIRAINDHVHWIRDELNNFSSGYKLFTIKSGILKTTIENNKIRDL